ncbi:MAG: toll/interleukin-1 receptor domain-containing protein [Muribaculaceae bacterium]|nr:toll/interleukin-1 receptor domain-containing protein [Muribaculaceae bacterium]
MEIDSTKKNIKFDVFISYSHEDEAVASKLCEELRNSGAVPWLAKEQLKGGSRFGDIIPDIIIGVKAVVVLLSKDAGNSNYVKNEVGIAFDNNIDIIPISLDSSELRGQLKLHLQDKHIVTNSNMNEVAQSISQFINHNTTIIPPSKYWNKKKIAIFVFASLLLMALGFLFGNLRQSHSYKHLFLMGSGTVCKYLNTFEGIHNNSDIFIFNAATYNALRLLREVGTEGAKNYHVIAMSAGRADINQIFDSLQILRLQKQKLKLVEVALGNDMDNLSVLLIPKDKFKEFVNEKNKTITVQNLDLLLHKYFEDKTINIFRTTLASSTLKHYNSLLTNKLDANNSVEFYNDFNRIELKLHKNKGCILLGSEYYIPDGSAYKNDNGCVYELRKDGEPISKALYLYFVVKDNYIPPEVSDFLKIIGKEEVIKHINDDSRIDETECMHRDTIN